MDGNNVKATILEEPEKKEAKKKQAKKRKLLALKFAAVLIVLAAGAYVVRAQLIVRDGCANRQNSLVYDKAAKLMNHYKVNELKTYTEEISKKRNWDKDINCVYPALYYRILISDSTGAKDYYNKVNALYDTKKGFAPAYRDIVTSMGQVDVQMQRLEESEKQMQNNRVFTN